VPDIPPELEEAIYRALAKKAQDRYQTAEEFGFDLLSVQRRLKQGMTAEFLQRAEAALERGELERAKQQLLEITRLDRHHERANRLLAEVRRTIQGKERAAQVVQMRSQAQVALAGQQYEEALACVEQALQLDPGDTESQALRTEIKRIVSVNKSIRDLLGRSESAMLAGDLDDARAAVMQALSYQPDNAEARGLAVMIENELAERSRRAQVQNLVDSAREGISKRQFEEAIQSLRKAEELDPTDSNVRELLQWATRGKEQELRRRELLDLTEEIDRALRSEDFSSAFTICELALAKFPNEQTLVRLKAIAERQKAVAERRQYVHDRSLAARELIEMGDLDRAIESLEDGLSKIAAEPNFETLLAHARKLKQEREASTERAAQNRAGAEARDLYRRRATEEGANLQKALDEREQVEFLKVLATNLSKMLNSMDTDEQTRRVCEPLLEQVRLRAEAKEQILRELGELRGALASSSDANLRTRASGRVVEAKAAFPRERDVRAACDEIAKIIEASREERSRATAELSRIAEEIGRVRLENAQALMARSDEIGAAYSSDPQVGALLQQIHFEVERRQKRLEARVREIVNLQNAIAEAPSVESISQLTQNAISIGLPDAEESRVAAAVESVRRAGDTRRRAIAESLGEVEEITNRALAALSVEDAERLLEDAKNKARSYSNIEEIQRNLVRVSAQIRGRRVEHDLVQGELQSLVKSVQDDASTQELEAIKRRASEVHDKYPQERTLVTLCRQVESAVDVAKEKFLQAEIERVKNEDQRWASQKEIEPRVLESSVRRLEDLVQAYPDSVELRSYLLKAQEALGRANRALRDTLSRDTFRQTGTAIETPKTAERKKFQPSVVSGAIAALVVAAVAIGWFAMNGSGDKATLTVETSPAGASVKVNGQSCSSQPCTFSLPRNASYEATANLAGYVSAQKTGVLSENNRVVLELSKPASPPIEASTIAEAHRTGRLVVAGLHASDRLFVDGVQMPKGDNGGGWTLDAGLHHFKLMDGNQELLADARQVKPDATLTVARSDFRALAPLNSAEQVAWDRAEQSKSIAGLEEFLKLYPASSRRDEAAIELERLYWQKAAAANTVSAYRDFLNRYPSSQGSHFVKANDSIDLLEWQSLQGSSDLAKWSAFLAAHPQGPYHQPALNGMDDIAWNAAKVSGRVEGLRTYQRDYPTGRHREEVASMIAQLTPAARTQPPPTKEVDVAPVRPTNSSAEHAESDEAAIRRVLDGYQDAYQSRSLDKLRALWPTISSSQASVVDSLFKGTKQILAPYGILNQEISGDEAKVSIQQFLQLGSQKPHTAKMTVILKRRSGSSWYISSIQ
jgi:hypothetical protein